MKKLKLTLVGILVLLAVIVILQNTDTVETRLFFVSVAMPRAVLLLTTGLIGFVLGLVFGAWVARGRRGRA